MNKKVYVGLFLSFFFVLTVFLMAVSLWIEDYEGDLTRYGAVSEHEYGWNNPLDIFNEDQTRYEVMHDKWNDSNIPDIVVFGDSFSHMPMGKETRNYAWTSFLYELFGLTAFVYHLEHDSVADWLDKHSPDTWPDYIVYERLEGRLKGYEAQYLPQKDCAINMEPLEYHSPPLLPMPKNMRKVERGGVSPFNLDAAIHWLGEKVNPRFKTYQFPLNRTDLFSHNKNDHLLIIAGIFRLHELMTEQKIRNVACFLWEAKQKAESNGRTKFIVAIVPDKFTAYEPFIDTELTTKKVYDSFQEQGLYVYRFDRYFREHIAKGDAGIDVYLPSDTHWGPHGSRIFASGIYSLMQE